MSVNSDPDPHGDLTKQIIGAGMSVHRALGPGLDEKIYANAPSLELAAQSLDFTRQQQFPVFYRDKIVGRLITDLIVENKVVVEAKVASTISDLHTAQTLGYPSITGLQIGLILNFQSASLAFKRVANVYRKPINKSV